MEKEIIYRQEVLDFLEKAISIEEKRGINLDDLTLQFFPSNKPLSINRIRQEVYNKTEEGIMFYNSCEQIYELISSKPKY